MSVCAKKTKQLPEAVTQEIDVWLSKYPDNHRQSALLPALHVAQDHHDNWLSNDVIEAVADYLGIPAIAAYEAASFYSMFNLKPVGRHQINVCTNISCMLCGCDKMVNHLEERLGVKMGETTKDGKYTLKGVECLAACVNAPMMQIDKTYHENLTPEKIDSILAEIE